MKKNEIKKLSEREHCLTRSSMYLGSIRRETHTDYVYESGSITKQTLEYTSGLVKIINEILDNAVDEAIRTSFKFSNKIEVQMDKTSFKVKDNGRGIPIHEVTIEKGEKILSPVLAWTHARAGSNFDDNSTQIGANGVGSALTNFFSKKFIGITRDGDQECVVECLDNCEKVNVSLGKSKHKGTEVTSYPDFERFDEKDFSDSYFKLIQTRLYFLSIAYPNITFSFNNKVIRMNTNTFLNTFSEREKVITNTENYIISLCLNETDELEHLTLLNGLTLKSGGSCVDFIVNGVSNIIKTKLSKKYPSIKTQDIKNKLLFVGVLRNFTDPKYDSQTKEKLTNSQKEVQDYFKIDLDELANKLYKNKEFISAVTDYYRIKEDYKRKQELKALEKTQKKIKSEKYTQSIGIEKYIFLCEGFSAVSSLQACLGRQNKGYFELKGKVANVSEDNKVITQNKELRELYQIIKSFNVNNPMYEITLDNKTYYARLEDSIIHDGKILEVKDLIK